MFERFTPPARQVVVHAQDEARGLGHGHIGGEHILLGLLCEKHGLGARALVSLGLTLDRVRTQVVSSLGSAEAPTTGQIPFTRAAVESLEGSTGEADAMNHGFVGTEHVLLGLAGVHDPTVESILAELGCSVEQIRSTVLAMLSGSS